VGLTTAASIWFTAAIGVAAGAGRIWLAVAGTIMAFFILTILRRSEHRGPVKD
jgi:putative Mg2+ transporter-C (MgtC) family protein